MSKQTALIADDESHVRTYLKALLTSMGLEVIGEATNGDEAVRLFGQHHPGLVGARRRSAQP